MELTVLIRRALDAAGYTDQEPTEENLRCCFYDYVVAGYWQNIDWEDFDQEDYTATEICRNLIGSR